MTDRAGHAEAHAWLHGEVAAGRVTLIGCTDLRRSLLSSLAASLADDALAPGIAHLVYEDVSSLLDSLESAQLLHFVAVRSMLLTAFLFATEFGLPLPDALVVSLANVSGNVLLLADDVLRERLRELRVPLPDLRFWDIRLAA